MASTRQRGHLVRMAHSIRKQTGFGQSLTLTEINTLLTPNNAIVPNIQYTTIPRMVTGLEFPHKSDVKSRRVTFQTEYSLTKSAAVLLGAFGMGEVASSGAGPFVETMKATNDSIEIPITAMIGEQIHGSKILFQDMAIQQFSINGSGNGEANINMSADWIGSGLYAEDQSFTFPASVTKEPFARMGRLAFSWGAYSSESEIGNRIKSFAFTHNNNLFDGWKPGGNLQAVTFEVGNRRACTFEFEVEADNTDDFIDELQAMTNGSQSTLRSAILTMTFDDGTDFLRLRMPQLFVASVTPTVGDDVSFRVACAPVFDPDSTGYTSGNQGPAILELSTAVQYTAPAPLGSFT